MRPTNEEMVYRREILAQEMSKNINELFKDTYSRVAQIISEKEGRYCSPTSIVNQWSQLKKEMNEIINNNKYNLSKRQIDILISKFNAYKTHKPYNVVVNNRERLSEELKLEFLKYVAKNYKKRISIRAMVNSYFRSERIEGKDLEDKLIRAWYKYLGLELTGIDLKADEKEKIKLYREVYIDKRNKKVNVEFNPELDENDLNNKESKKNVSEKSVNKKYVSNKINKEKEDDTMVNDMYKDSDFILKENQDGTYTMIKGISYVDKEFVSEKLKSNDKVLVLTSDKEVIAKNFL